MDLHDALAQRPRGGREWMSAMGLDRQEVQERVRRAFSRQKVLDACKQRKIGPIITTLRRHGISQGLISALTGIPQGRLSEYERNVRQPTLETFDKFATGLSIPEAARQALGLTSAEPPKAALTASSEADPSTAPDLLTVAWMAGSLNSHADRRDVLQFGATLAAAPLLGVEEPMERLAYALIGAVALQEDTIAYLEQRTVGLHRIEELYPARMVHRAITSPPS